MLFISPKVRPRTSQLPGAHTHAHGRAALLQGDCLTEPGMVRALRCQLPLHNLHYAPVPDRQQLPPQVRRCLACMQSPVSALR